MENLTSLLVSGSPLWNLTSGRSLNSQVVSSRGFHSVASWGMSFRSGSRVVRLSKIWNDTVMLLTAVLSWGFRKLMSELVTTTSVRLSAGALSVAATAVGCAAGAAGWAAAGFATGCPAGAGAAAAGLVGSAAGLAGAGAWGPHAARISGATMTAAHNRRNQV